MGRYLPDPKIDRLVADLVRAGTVSADEARVRSSRLDELERLLAG